MEAHPAARCFTALAVSSVEDLGFGCAPKPVRCGFDLTIGGGLVYPEVNFTLPPLTIAEASWGEVLQHYEEMAEGILRRAVALRVPGLVLEFEHLPPMTEQPAWGGELTALLHRHLEQAQATHGLRSALRVTPVDLRDQVRPPLLRTGEAWEKVQRSFEVCADAGAHILSIESIGGKEVCDEALLAGDIEGIVFARHEYLTGCSKVTLQPRGVDKDGKPRESAWFDEQTVEVLLPVSPEVLVDEPTAPSVADRPGGPLGPEPRRGL